MTRGPNQALKLTRRAVCLRGGPSFGRDAAMQWSCASPAVQLSAAVSQTKALTKLGRGQLEEFL